MKNGLFILGLLLSLTAHANPPVLWSGSNAQFINSGSVLAPSLLAGGSSTQVSPVASMIVDQNSSVDTGLLLRDTSGNKWSFEIHPNHFLIEPYGQNPFLWFNGPSNATNQNWMGFGPGTHAPTWPIDFNMPTNAVTNVTSLSQFIPNNGTLFPPAVVMQNLNATANTMAGFVTTGSSQNAMSFAGTIHTTQTAASEQSEYIIATQNSGTLTEGLRVKHDQTLQAKAYSTGIAHLDASGNVTSSAVVVGDMNSSTATNGYVPTANGSGGVSWSAPQGGGGSKNYLTTYTASTSSGTANSGNGDFEFGNTTGWSLAHSALSGTTPTSTATAGTGFDSTHGGTAASVNLSLSAVTSGALQKTYSGQLSSSAASTAGDMLISKPFYIDKADQTQPMTISLTTNVTANASNLNFSGTSSNSFAVWVYDVTAGSWIQPSGVYGLVSSGVYNVKNIVFQPQSSSSTQYQLALININASAGAYTMLLDAIGVGPQPALSSPAMTDAVAFTPTGTWTTNTTYTGWMKREGDQLVVTGEVSLSGAPNPGELDINLPPGLTIDTTKAPSLVRDQIGQTMLVQTGTGQFPGMVEYRTSTTVALSAPGAASTYLGSDNFVNQVLPFTWGSGHYATYWYRVPIVGWSSNTASSADSDGHKIAARYNATGSLGALASGAIVNFDTKEYDYAGNVTTGASWKFTASESGTYKIAASLVSGSFTPTAGNVYGIDIYKNGVFVARLATITANAAVAQTIHLQGDTELLLNANDYIDIRTNISSGTLTPVTDYRQNFVTVSKTPPVPIVQATETVVAAYDSATTSVGTATSPRTIAVFTNKIKDSHGAYNTSTGKYTVPVSGSYETCCHMVANATANTTSQDFEVWLNKNGSDDHELGRAYGNGASISIGAQGCFTQSYLQGDTVACSAFNGAGSVGLVGSVYTTFSITKVGN